MEERKYGVCAGGLREAIQVAIDNDLSVMQIFTADPHKFSSDLTELFEAKPFRDSHPQVDLIAHASLMTNLVNPKPQTRTFSINNIVAEMKRCAVLGIKHIVAHPGSTEEPNGPTQLGRSLMDIAARMESYGKPMVQYLCIENMVGSGNQIMSKPEHFKELFDCCQLPNIKICLDSAHAWGAGYKPMEFIKGLESLGILDKLKVVHFNNTVSKFGSHKERHAELAEGVISQEDLQEFADYLKTRPDVLVVEEQPVKSDLDLTIKHLKEKLK